MRIEMEETTAADWWWLFLVTGVVSLLIGAALIWFRVETLTFVGIMIGLWILFFGIIRFLLALFGGESEGRVMLAVVGVLGIALGIIVMKNPTETIGIIAVIIGLFWIVFGLIDVFQGVTNSDLPGRWWTVLGGVVAAGAGVLLVFWTEPTVLVLALIAGIFLIIEGVLEIIAAFQVKAA
jgi:uncharacterized membrane protein HdeD (DUF308 family)